MNNKDDQDNLELILDKGDELHGIKYREEVVDIVTKFPNSFGYCLAERKEGTHNQRAGTKVKGYYMSDEYVFIQLTENRYIKFNHNQVKPSEDSAVEE